METRFEEEESHVPSNDLVSRLLTVLPAEIRLQIYELVFHGSRARLLSIHQRTPSSKTLALRPSHHYRLLLVCHQIYAESLSAYWSSTTIDSALNPPFEYCDFSEVLRTIPVFAQPFIREIRCKGFQEIPSLNFKQFVDHFARIKTIVMEPAFLHVSRRFYEDSDWSADVVIQRAQRDLHRSFPMFGLVGPSSFQVLQRVQFPVIVRRSGMRIRLSARDKNYPAKVSLWGISMTVFLEADC